MFTDVDAVRSLDLTATIIWAGLAFTAALLVSMALIARAMRWDRHDQDEETTAKRHTEVPQAA